jgi:hypothetical protein
MWGRLGPLMPCQQRPRLLPAPARRSCGSGFVGHSRHFQRRPSRADAGGEGRNPPHAAAGSSDQAQSQAQQRRLQGDLGEARAVVQHVLDHQARPLASLWPGLATCERPWGTAADDGRLLLIVAGCCHWLLRREGGGDPCSGNYPCSNTWSANNVKVDGNSGVPPLSPVPRVLMAYARTPASQHCQH